MGNLTSGRLMPLLSHTAAGGREERQAIKEPARRRQGALRADPTGALSEPRQRTVAPAPVQTSQEPAHQAPITVLSTDPTVACLT